MERKESYLSSLRASPELLPDPSPILGRSLTKSRFPSNSSLSKLSLDKERDLLNLTDPQFHNSLSKELPPSDYKQVLVKYIREIKDLENRLKEKDIECNYLETENDRINLQYQELKQSLELKNSTPSDTSFMVPYNSRKNSKQLFDSPIRSLGGRKNSLHFSEDKISDLEKEISELQLKLDKITQEKSLQEKEDRKTISKLQNEIDTARKEAEESIQQVIELKNSNRVMEQKLRLAQPSTTRPHTRNKVNVDEKPPVNPLTPFEPVNFMPQSITKVNSKSLHPPKSNQTQSNLLNQLRKRNEELIQNNKELEIKYQESCDRILLLEKINQRPIKAHKLITPSSTKSSVVKTINTQSNRDSHKSGLMNGFSSIRSTMKTATSVLNSSGLKYLSDSIMAVQETINQNPTGSLFDLTSSITNHHHFMIPEVSGLESETEGWVDTEKQLSIIKWIHDQPDSIPFSPSLPPDPPSLQQGDPESSHYRHHPSQVNEGGHSMETKLANPELAPDFINTNTGSKLDSTTHPSTGDLQTNHPITTLRSPTSNLSSQLNSLKRIHHHRQPDLMIPHPDNLRGSTELNSIDHRRRGNRHEGKLISPAANTPTPHFGYHTSKDLDGITPYPMDGSSGKSRQNSLACIGIVSEGMTPTYDHRPPSPATYLGHRDAQLTSQLASEVYQPVTPVHLHPPHSHPITPHSGDEIQRHHPPPSENPTIQPNNHHPKSDLNFAVPHSKINLDPDNITLLRRPQLFPRTIGRRNPPELVAHQLPPTRGESGKLIEGSTRSGGGWKVSTPTNNHRSSPVDPEEVIKLTSRQTHGGDLGHRPVGGGDEVLSGDFNLSRPLDGLPPPRDRASPPSKEMGTHFHYGDDGRVVPPLPHYSNQTKSTPLPHHHHQPPISSSLTTTAILYQPQEPEDNLGSIKMEWGHRTDPLHLPYQGHLTPSPLPENQVVTHRPPTTAQYFHLSPSRSNLISHSHHFPPHHPDPHPYPLHLTPIAPIGLFHTLHHHLTTLEKYLHLILLTLYGLLLVVVRYFLSP